MIGRVIGHFEIRERIGAGAMGEVYLAWDSHLRRKVALKFLPPSTISNVVARQRLRREALALSRLNHPVVATLHDFLSDSEHDCLVMEYVAGEPLDKVVRRGPLDEELLLGYAVQIADGLAAAHAAKVVHRDLKPANLRITPEGRVKILDFGLARQVARGESATGTPAAEGYVEGEIAGTMAYIAPEVWSGQPFEPSADLYSLGVVLYELATGSHPFEGLTGSALVHAIKEEPPLSARTRAPSLSPEFNDVIGRLLAKRPEDRFASARELHAVLDALHAARRSGSTASSRLRRRRVAAPRLLAAAAVLALAVAATLWLALGRPPAAAVVVGVLPFSDLSEDSLGAYFADGVTSELTNRLAENDSLQVISGTTMMRYRGGGRRIPEVAREIGADRVVQGSVRRHDGRVRFSVQVVDGRTDRIRWSRSYDGQVEQIVQMEDRIARELTAAFGARASSATRPRRDSERVDPLAYDLYLRGLYELDRRDESGIRLARAHFTRSLERDSTFAPAWAALANAWSAAGHGGFERPLDAFPQARRAALRALELDPELADGHVALANILQNHDWDWAAAEREYTRAIELNPSHAVAHHWYANHLALRGAFGEALVEIGRARALDPVSLPLSVGPAAILYFARRYPEALDSLDAAVAMDPASGLVQRTRAAILDRLGRRAEAIRAIRVWLDGQRLGALSAAVGDAYDTGGMDAALTVMIAGLERKRASGQYEPATHIAELYARLGRRESAMHWLLVAERERDTELNRLKVDPIFDPLRGDPRFEALVERVGLGGRAAARAAAPAGAGTPK